MARKNPVLQKKFKEGYEKGFIAGKDFGIKLAVDYIAKRFDELQDMPGIGPKTIEKFMQAFGEDYFQKVE